MTATINQCLGELKTLFETADFANAVYDYRTFPDKLTIAVTLSYEGGNPHGTNTTDGDSGYYEFIAVCMVQTALDDAGKVSETALRTADHGLNTLENAVYDLMKKGGAGNRGAHWIKTSFPAASKRSPSPIQAPTTRWSFIPFRLTLK